jgi:hypothetical protein
MEKRRCCTPSILIAGVFGFAFLLIALLLVAPGVPFGSLPVAGRVIVGLVLAIISCACVWFIIRNIYEGIILDVRSASEAKRILAGREIEADTLFATFAYFMLYVAVAIVMTNQSSTYAVWLGSTLLIASVGIGAIYLFKGAHHTKEMINQARA